MRRLYAIRDRLAEEVISMQMYALMAFRTDEQAARYFADAVNDTTSMLAKHPADYELIFVGKLQDNGTIIPETEPRIMITGDALLAVQQPVDIEPKHDNAGKMPRNLQYETGRQ